MRSFRGRIATGFLLLLCGWAAPLCGQEKGWTPLFDGKSIDNWVKRGGNGIYTVEDGMIVGTTAGKGPNTFLCTPRDYCDFVLEFNVKVDPSLNSGVQFRSLSLPEYKNGQVHGYQAEIDPSERSWSGGIYDEGRRLWLADLKENEPGRTAFKLDDWNHYRIEARGDTMRTWVNNVPTAMLIDDMTSCGFIGLQVHSTTSTVPLKVSWKDLRILELAPLGGAAGQEAQADAVYSPSEGKTAPEGAVVLLDANATSLDEWQTSTSAQAPWTQVAGGKVEIFPGSGSLYTKRKFGDCKLHVEFRIPPQSEAPDTHNGNSGVYLMSRYEVQVLDSAGQEPSTGSCGGIYKVAPPRVNAAAPRGAWQTYDIMFRAPRIGPDGKKLENANITVVHNGICIHRGLEIPGPTGGGASNVEDTQPAPLELQDHGSRVQYRNIWLLEPGHAH